MYKIQRHPQADPDIVHVDKLMPYYPDFGERLHSWIETDCPTQYRDQEAQTSKPVLQDQMVAVLDIPPPILDPATARKPAEPHPDAPSPTEEPVETSKTHTTSPQSPKFNPRCWRPCQMRPQALSRSPDRPTAPKRRQT